MRMHMRAIATHRSKRQPVCWRYTECTDEVKRARGAAADRISCLVVHGTVLFERRTSGGENEDQTVWIAVHVPCAKQQQSRQSRADAAN